jgi:hypothetical protein
VATPNFITARASNNGTAIYGSCNFNATDPQVNDSIAGVVFEGNELVITPSSITGAQNIGTILTMQLAVRVGSVAPFMGPTLVIGINDTQIFLTSLTASEVSPSIKSFTMVIPVVCPQGGNIRIMFTGQDVDTFNEAFVAFSMFNTVLQPVYITAN